MAAIAAFGFCVVLVLAFELEVRSDVAIAANALDLRATALAAGIAAACDEGEPRSPRLAATVADLAAHAPDLASIVLRRSDGRAPEPLFTRPGPRPQTVVRAERPTAGGTTVEIVLDRNQLEERIGLEHHELLEGVVKALGAAAVLGAAAAIYLPRRRLKAVGLELGSVRERTSRTIECLGSALLSVDAGGKVEAVNAAGRRRLESGGASLPAEVLGVAQAIARDPAHTPWSGEMTTEGRTCTYRLTGLEPGLALVVADDVTELRALEQRLRESERLAELGEMAASLAHELKNPITAIGTYAQLAPARLDDAAFRAEFQQVLRDETARLSRFLERVRLLGAPLATALAPLDLGEVADAAVAPHRPSLDGAKISVAIARSGAVPVLGDAELLREAIENIVLNARDALAGAGGRLDVTVARSGGDALVTIKDDGPGMRQETLERVGTPFFSTRVAGTGIGIAFARRIARAHGGTLEVSSAPGQGTSVVLRVPLRAGQVTLGAA